jgi:hypothetical protein
MASLTTQFPQNPSFQTVDFKLNTPSQTTETNSGKVRRTGYGVSYYSFDVRYPSLTPLEAGTVQGFVAQTYGPQLSFEIVLPEVSYSKSTNKPTTRVRVGAENTSIGATNLIGAKAVQLENCGSLKRVLAAGDFFKFSGHSKVYMCVSPCDSDNAGNATLYFSGSAVNNFTLINRSCTISGTTLTTTGLTGSEVGQSITGTGITNGTFIVSVTSATTAVLNFSHSILTPRQLTFHDSLTIDAVPFTCILADDVQEWSVGFGGMTTMDLAMREDW